MTDYGFGKKVTDAKELAVDLTKIKTKSKEPVSDEIVTKVVEEGAKRGFIDRSPSNIRRPGPKRREDQAKLTMAGPKRVMDEFREYCDRENLTLWEGLETLMAK